MRSLGCTSAVVVAAFVSACSSASSGPANTAGAGGGSSAGTGGSALAGQGGTDAAGAAGSASPGAGGVGTGGSAGGGGAGGDAGAAGAACGDDPVQPPTVLGSGADPTGGTFTMDQALDGLPDGPGPLRALIDTDLGLLTCELRPDVAPIGVANFVGLARAKRPWKKLGGPGKADNWVTSRFYDGLLFHRVIPKFVAQGGDPTGTGNGGPGYQFVNEIGALKHQPGTLAYANAGKDTNGSQFYVAEVALPSLDGGYTIFGSCTPISVVTALTHVPTAGTAGKPVTDLHMKTVSITRCAP